jgi:hypothetical protein
MTAAKIDLAALARRGAVCAGLGIELLDASVGRAVTRVTVGDGKLVAGLTGTAFVSGEPIEV